VLIIFSIDDILENHMYVVEKIIPRPEYVLDKLPSSPELRERVQKDRQEIFDILEGRDQRKLLIVGPCSAWPDTAVIEYAKQLRAIARRVEDKLKIIMRVYTQKPRTMIGWTGPINQPDPFKPADIEAGILYCRNMMLQIAELGLPVADEAVFTHNEGYFSDLLSWIAIGARSAEDQEHRIYASMVNLPVGMKNPTSGDLEIGVHSVVAAQHPHVFLLHGRQIRTKGNPHAHLVLRGGRTMPNYDVEHLKKACAHLKKHTVSNPSILVDVSHDNCKRDPLRQPEILLNVVDSMHRDEEIKTLVKGFMLESFLKTGNQDLKAGVDHLDLTGLSVTDPCIGIEKSEELIGQVYDLL
jgi:3-deoxy-7-phosphoheptulonate synthase